MHQFMSPGKQVVDKAIANEPVFTYHEKFHIYPFQKMIKKNEY